MNAIQDNEVEVPSSSLTNRAQQTEGSSITQRTSHQRATLSEENDIVLSHKARLYQLFGLIEREFDALYDENQLLRAHHLSNGRNEGDKGAFPENICTMAELEDPPNLREHRHEMSEESRKASSLLSRKVQSRQRWRALKVGQSGRLVTSLRSNASDSTQRGATTSLRGHQDGIWHVFACAVGRRQLIATASADQTARVYSADDTTHCLGIYQGHGGSVNSISIRAAGEKDDGNLTVLTTSGDRSAHIWRLPIEPGEENTARRVDACQGVERHSSAPQAIQQPLIRLSGHSDAVVSGVWLTGGEQVLTASWDRTANIYDVETGKVLHNLSGGIATCSIQLPHAMELRHDQELTYSCSHEAQRLVATASRDYTFRLWDFREPIQSVAVFQGHNGPVTSVGFTSLHHIVSGSDDRSVKVWDLRNMRSPITTIRLDSAVNRLSICGKYHLIAIPLDSRHVCVYDLSGSRLARMPRNSGRFFHSRMVTGTAWLADHPTNNLFSCGFDKQIIGWRVETPNK